jgi:probable phosphoglycerate mutase
MPRKSPDESQASFAFSSDSRQGGRDDDRLAAYIDGGARGNPGEAGAGVYFERNGSAWRGLYRYLGRTTNNYAEYSALIEALHYALKEGFRKLMVYADSELLVKQMRGSYRVKHPVLRELYAQAKELAHRLERFELHHIPREKNHPADALANRAQDSRASGEEHYS